VGIPGRRNDELRRRGDNDIDFTAAMAANERLTFSAALIQT